MSTLTAAPAKTLHPYQQDAIAAAHKTWSIGYQRIVTVMPTGTGKTFVFSSMIGDEAATGRRVLVIVDAEELVGQTVDTLAEAMPGIHVGIVKAGKNHALAQVIVASIQTLAKPNRRAAIGRFSLIIIDECHMAAAQSYIDAVRDLGGYSGNSAPIGGTRVIGFTATADRTGVLGLGDIWQIVAYQLPVEWAFEHGYLHRPQIVRPTLASDDPQAIVNDLIARVGNEQGVFFTRNVKRAHQIRDAFRRSGITAEVIYDGIKKPERDRIYDATRRARNQVLVNVNVLVKGFDMPQLLWAGMDRKMTQVPYVQAVGRALRTFKGSAYAPPKQRARVIDYAGNKHSLQVVPNLAPTIEGKREAAAASTSKARVEARRKPGDTRYLVHVRKPLIGRKHVLVERIERTGTVTVAKIYGHPTPRLKALGLEAVEADKRRRMDEITSQINKARRVA